MLSIRVNSENLCDKLIHSLQAFSIFLSLLFPNKKYELTKLIVILIYYKILFFHNLFVFRVERTVQLEITDNKHTI